MHVTKKLREAVERTANFLDQVGENTLRDRVRERLVWHEKYTGEDGATSDMFEDDGDGETLEDE